MNRFICSDWFPGGDFGLWTKLQIDMSFVGSRSNTSVGIWNDCQVVSKSLVDELQNPTRIVQQLAKLSGSFVGVFCRARK